MLRYAAPPRVASSAVTLRMETRHERWTRKKECGSSSRSVSASVRRLDPRYELAAMSLGAGPIETFRHITLPLLRSALVVAGLLAFLASFNEFLITLFVIGASEATLPIQLWKGVRFETNPTIAAASTLFLAISTMVLIGIEAMKWRQRRITGARGDLLSG